MLVGRLHPRNGNSSKWLPSGQDSRLVATAALSFHPNSRETFLSLKPPEEEAYLCNIAVVSEKDIVALLFRLQVMQLTSPAILFK